MPPPGLQALNLVGFEDSLDRIVYLEIIERRSFGESAGDEYFT